MKTDTYGQLIFTEMELCLLYLQDPLRKFNRPVFVNGVINFNDILEIENPPTCIPYVAPTVNSVTKFDENNQNNWLMPKEYYDLDIASYILDKCKGDAELQRAGQELLLFQERGMFDLLRYLKYLVDVMRENDIVWGVGRGSSVSSFVLFLLGVHKINSLYYDLSIDEFIK
jgi:DNA polymerase III alpha subunit